MAFTLDDSILNFEGGWDVPDNWAKAGMLLIGALLVVLALLIVVKLYKAAQERFGGAPGRADVEPGMLSSLATTSDNYWGSAMNRLGVDQDTVGVMGSRENMCGDNFVVNVNGKMYSDEPTSQYFVKPDASGKYQSLNPEAPHFMPSAADVAAALASAPTVSPAEARVATVAVSNYRIGRITAQNCGALNDISQREQTAAYDWMNTIPESPYSGSVQKPAEMFMKERYLEKLQPGWTGGQECMTPSGSDEMTRIMSRL